MIRKERVRPLNNGKEKGRDYVFSRMRAKEGVDAYARKFEVKYG